MRAPTLTIACTGLALGAAGLVGVPALAAGPTLQVTATTRSGEKVEPLAYAMNLKSGKKYSVDASATKSLPAGRYAVGAFVQEAPTGGSGLLDLTVAARIVQIAGATTVDFNLAKAKKVVLGVDDKAAKPVALAVVPFANVGGKPKKFINEAGISWPATGTYVLPSNDQALSLGVHGVLGTPGDAPGPVRYDLARMYKGLPAVSIKAKKAQLAKVNLNVAVVDRGQGGFMQLIPATPKRRAITGVDLGVPVLGKQVSYRTPSLQWETRLNISGLSATNGFAQLTEKFKRKGTKPFLYAAGKTYGETWGLGVWGPRANSPAIFKQGGKVNVRGGQPICPFAGAGVTLDDCQFQPTTFSYRLARSGSVVSQGTAVSAGLGAAPSWYTAKLNATREIGDLMKSVEATWYFRASSKSLDGPLGAGNLQIAPAGLDAFHVAAAASTPVQVTVVGMKGVKTVTVEYSTDGGKSWKKAATSGKGAKWTGRVANPSGEGAVSLRVKATSGNGAFVSYTVADAYGVK
ncbi:MAG: hypothetical protein ACT4QF_23415 [Sporichthyaceae bacterium]